MISCTLKYAVLHSAKVCMFAKTSNSLSIWSVPVPDKKPEEKVMKQHGATAETQMHWDRQL